GGLGCCVRGGRCGFRGRRLRGFARLHRGFLRLVGGLARGLLRRIGGGRRLLAAGGERRRERERDHCDEITGLHRILLEGDGAIEMVAIQPLIIACPLVVKTCRAVLAAGRRGRRRFSYTRDRKST